MDQKRLKTVAYTVCDKLQYVPCAASLLGDWHLRMKQTAGLRRYRMGGYDRTLQRQRSRAS